MSRHSHGFSLVRASGISKKLRSSVCVALTVATVLGVFQFASSQTLTTLHSFTFNRDGAEPLGGLIRDLSGNLYGTTHRGGNRTCNEPVDQGCGAVFKLDKSGKETMLYRFSGPDGAHPLGRLFRDGFGNLFGMTASGGAFGFGVVFRLTTKGDETVLYSFMGQADGGRPAGGLASDGAGNLYGTTQIGGDLSCFAGSGCGVVFKLDRSGKETVLHSFTNADGANPQGRLVLDPGGNLYGTTQIGGLGAGIGNGTVFEVDHRGTFSVLYMFAGGEDGSQPTGDLVRDRAGKLYGTTSSGGNLSCNNSFGCGTVFRIDGPGSKAVLHSFTGGDGSAPNAGVIRDAAGNLYGTTGLGGDLNCPAMPKIGCGVVYKLDAAGHETLLHVFEGNSDGFLVYDRVILSAAGDLFGETYVGGDSGRGTVFKIHR